MLIVGKLFFSGFHFNTEKNHITCLVNLSINQDD